MGEPFHAGLVAGLARPGANYYGKIVHRPDLQAKRLELLKEIAPNISRLAVLSNAGIPPAEVALQELKSAAKKLDVDVQPVQISRPNDFYAAFAAIANQRLDALCSCFPIL